MHFHKKVLGIMNGASFNADLIPLFRISDVLILFYFASYQASVVIHKYANLALPETFQNNFCHNSDYHSYVTPIYTVSKTIFLAGYNIQAFKHNEEISALDLII